MVATDTPHARAWPAVRDVCGAGLFDGFRVDEAGTLWTSSADRVRPYAPDGTLPGRVPVPELVSNPSLRRPEAEPAVHHGAV